MRYLITGHTGFKGAWLSLALETQGNELFGFSLPPTSDKGIYQSSGVEQFFSKNTYGDIRNAELVSDTISDTKPEIIFHLAAQPIVSTAYKNPLETFTTNLIGTANLLEAARNSPNLKAVIVITSDKCYAESPQNRPHIETNPLGGSDIYSSSKAAQEIIAQSYAKTFLVDSGISLATVRAGNVIGGGDWSKDRLIPDIVRANQDDQTLEIRKPEAVRPWQHVLEPIFGYMLSAEYLLNQSKAILESWNFGPTKSDEISVADLLIKSSQHIVFNHKVTNNGFKDLKETKFLTLNSDKAKAELGWAPKWNIDKALR
jgi:CDP-glucose 4,6-dehydratase